DEPDVTALGGQLLGGGAPALGIPGTDQDGAAPGGQGTSGFVAETLVGPGDQSDGVGGGHGLDGATASRDRGGPTDRGISCTTLAAVAARTIESWRIGPISRRSCGPAAPTCCPPMWDCRRPDHAAPPACDGRRSHSWPASPSSTTCASNRHAARIPRRR